MSTGTKSLLFGVHQFLWHPFTVWRAWVKLYGRPTWRECVCIFVHDWGYWGCPEMDGAKGELHPFVGARIAGWLFGFEYHELVLNHSRYLSKKRGVEPSRLCWADKFSMVYDPQWFYLRRARMSGELAEYRDNAARRQFIGREAPDEEWHTKLVRHLDAMARERALSERRAA